MNRFAAQTAPIWNGTATLAQTAGLSNDEVEKLYAAGYQFFMQARYRDAHPLLRLVAMCDHRSERYWIALAACRQMMGDFLLAAESYITAAGLSVQKSAAAIQATFCLIRSGEFATAQVWLEEAERRLQYLPDDEASIKKCRALRRAINRAIQPCTSTASR